MCVNDNNIKTAHQFFLTFRRLVVVVQKSGAIITSHVLFRIKGCHSRKLPSVDLASRASSVDSVAQTARLLANQIHFSPPAPQFPSVSYQWTAEDSCQCHRRLWSRHQRRQRYWRRWRNSWWRTGIVAGRRWYNTVECCGTVSLLPSGIAPHPGQPAQCIQRIKH